MSRFICAVCMMAVLVSAGCGLLSSNIYDAQTSSASTFDIQLLPSPSGVVDSASLAVSTDTATHVVVDVNVQGAQDLTGLLFKLAYDPALYRPMTVEPGAALGDRDEIISLMVPVKPGELQFGAVLTHPDLRAGFNGGATLAQVSFRKTPDLVTRRVSTPVTTAASRLQDMNFIGASRLGWSYSLSGDYDQNGEVNIADLMPIGQHYKEVSPAGLGMPFPFATAASQVDGDANGEIGLSDLTAISRNFGVDALGGFRVFASTDQLDCPTDPIAPNGAGAVELTTAPVALTDAGNLGAKSDERLAFQVPLAQPIADNFYWVRPYDSEGNPGIPSLYDPSGVAIPIQLATDAVPDSGSGVQADPFVLQDIKQYNFALVDTESGADLSLDPGTQFIVDAAAGSFAGNQLSITPGYEGEFTVSAEFNGLPVNGDDSGGSEVFCRSLSMPQGIRIDPDPADTDWTGVTGTGEDEPNQFILHTQDNTFNPDGDADNIYDLVFSLQATTVPGGAVIPSADLDWDCFPPFCVADPPAFTADATAGTFQAWTFTSGYVFAQNPASPGAPGRSNDLYIVVQSLP